MSTPAPHGIPSSKKSKQKPSNHSKPLAHGMPQSKKSKTNNHAVFGLQQLQQAAAAVQAAAAALALAQQVAEQAEQALAQHAALELEQNAVAADEMVDETDDYVPVNDHATHHQDPHPEITAEFNLQTSVIYERIRTNPNLYYYDVNAAMELAPRVKSDNRHQLFGDGHLVLSKLAIAFETMQPSEYQVLARDLAAENGVDLDITAWYLVNIDPDQRLVLPTRNTQSRHVSSKGGWKTFTSKGVLRREDLSCGDSMVELNGKRFKVYSKFKQSKK